MRLAAEMNLASSAYRSAGRLFQILYGYYKTGTPPQHQEALNSRDDRTPLPAFRNRHILMCLVLAVIRELALPERKHMPSMRGPVFHCDNLRRFLIGLRAD